MPINKNPTHGLNDTSYEPVTQNEGTAQQDLLDFDQHHIRFEIREGIWQTLAEQNVSERPNNFETIIDGAIASLRTMNANWAVLPESYL